jgi:hypothetical protein
LTSRSDIPEFRCRGCCISWLDGDLKVAGNDDDDDDGDGGIRRLENKSEGHERRLLEWS